MTYDMKYVLKYVIYIHKPIYLYGQYIFQHMKLLQILVCFICIYISDKHIGIS